VTKIRMKMLNCQGYTLFKRLEIVTELASDTRKGIRPVKK